MQVGKGKDRLVTDEDEQQMMNKTLRQGLETQHQPDSTAIMGWDHGGILVTTVAKSEPDYRGRLNLLRATGRLNDPTGPSRIEDS